MQVLDRKFKKHKTKYISQTLFATLSILIVLLVLEARTQTALIAVLGSSSFLVFAAPRKEMSKPRYLIGGYCMGMAAGVVCHFLYPLFPLSLAGEVGFYAVFGAISVGLSTFLMVTTNTEHPPAAGLALALILNEWKAATLVIVMAGIILLSIIRTVFKQKLINLV